MFEEREQWVNWQRDLDYYPEGDLLWLEVAALMHDQTNGQKSFEDFCRAFCGGPNEGPQLKTYTLEDLVRALQDVVPYDWAGFFHDRLTSISPKAPLGGIEAGGWKVAYTEQPLEFQEEGASGGGVNALYSLGLRVGANGSILDSLVTGPAYLAGITPGMRLMAVDDRTYTSDLLHDKLKASTKNDQPIRLLVLNDDYYKTYSVDYHGGERYPHLIRAEGKPDLLDDIAKPLAAQK
jgi:predicted metalloprotease with PDZ domain